MSAQSRYNLRSRIPKYYSASNFISNIPDCCHNHDDCTQPIFEDTKMTLEELTKIANDNKSKYNKSIAKLNKHRRLAKTIPRTVKKQQDVKSTNSKRKKKRIRTFQQFSENNTDIKKKVPIKAHIHNEDLTQKKK
eukprot:422603_1